MGNTKQSKEASGKKILYPSSKRKSRRNIAKKIAKLKEINRLSEKEGIGDVMFMDTSNIVIENIFSEGATGDIKLKKQQEVQAVNVTIQEQEASGSSSFEIKQEITIDESNLDHLNFPKLETFENTSAGTDDETALRSDPLESPAVPSNAPSDTFHSNESDKGNQVEKHGFLNIVPKLEPLQNTSEDINRVEENCNSNIFPSTSNKFHKKRKTNDKDNRIEEDEFAEYGMYIANRLRNANQSDSAIALAKQEIEVILNELERGIFEISLH